MYWIDPFGLAQFGYRPLGNGHEKLTGKLPANSSSSDLHYMHEQLWFDDHPNQNVGFFNGDGTGPGWSMCGEKGEVRSDKGHTRSQYRFIGPVYNDAQMREAVDIEKGNWSSKDYCLVGQNCQDFSSALRGEYNRLSDLKEEEKLGQDPFHPWDTYNNNNHGPLP